MSLVSAPARDHTVRDPRGCETGYRVEYVFELEARFAPWLVEVPVPEGLDGSYRVTMIVERARPSEAPA